MEKSRTFFDRIYTDKKYCSNEFVELAMERFCDLQKWGDQEPERNISILECVNNIEKVKELEPLFYGEYTVTLHNGKRLTLSRRYRRKLPLLGVS